MGKAVELIDSFGRKLNYVRISVTDRCNYRCVYCMPPEGVQCIDHKNIMRYEEIAFLCAVFAGLGVNKFRFTGGEPLVRKGLVDFLINLHKSLPSVKLTITTNASLLEKYAAGLREAGIRDINISLDTLDKEKFRYITRLGSIDEVIRGIEKAKSLGFNIKINSVLIRGFNDNEAESLIRFALERDILIRFIEFMPLQETIWKKTSFMSGTEMLGTLPFGGEWRKEEQTFGSNGPAQYYINSEDNARVGIITAVSNHFCKSCNRLRVSSDGHLRTCLFNPKETALKHILETRDKDVLMQTILECVSKKPRCWNDINTGNINMNKIGG